MNKCAVDFQDRAFQDLQTITQNWRVPAAKTIKNEVIGTICFCCIAQVFAIY